MEEIWKDINGYEEMYQVSNFGNVRSIDRFVNHNYGGKMFLRGQNKKIRINKDGYCDILLSKYSIKKHFTIHRLVANAFLLENKKEAINHINGIKTDNKAENLEWCTHQENIDHVWKILGYKRPSGEDSVSNMITIQCSLDGFILNVFYSRKHAQDETKIKASHIVECIKGKSKTAGGYIWL